MKHPLVLAAALAAAFLAASCQQNWYLNPDGSRTSSPKLQIDGIDLHYDGTGIYGTSSDSFAGVTLSYTLDGSEPGANSPKTKVESDYAGLSVFAIAMSSFPSTVVFRGLYTKDGWEDASQSATLHPKCGTPTISAHYYGGSDVYVSITVHDAAATIRYSSDGSDPTELSSTWSAALSPITGNASTVIKARAYRSGFEASDIATGRVVSY